MENPGACPEDLVEGAAETGEVGREDGWRDPSTLEGRRPLFPSRVHTGLSIEPEQLRQLMSSTVLILTIVWWFPHSGQWDTSSNLVRQ